MKLRKKSVAKPWGKTDLPQVFGGTRKRKIGEIWFEPPAGIVPGLMIKYLFTSEKLSVQVHPSDAQAPQGLSGKEECWLVLDADELVHFDTIEGEVPSPLAPPSGCFYHPRCPLATAECSTDQPEMQDLSEGRAVACHHHQLQLTQANSASASISTR